MLHLLYVDVKALFIFYRKADRNESGERANKKRMGVFKKAYTKKVTDDGLKESKSVEE